MTEPLIAQHRVRFNEAAALDRKSGRDLGRDWLTDWSLAVDTG